ncbi:hypothetical protein FFLO_03220 [Filobasidium floriforme]|uniref:4-nitrophenylphosphatase n=1 Tax=Filobasidium floriforme TaxID=5210 RepID=A0A8K0JLL0_9TREE|nr:hypothetical protein FFLO_03220 [Filobasidium floriforme]
MSDTTESKRLTTAQDYASLIDKFDTFLFDCDGVIWSGPKLIPGVREVIAWLRTKGKNVLFVSNNASKSRPMYKKTFDDFGIDTTDDELFNSGFASALYLAKILNFPKDKKVYVIGMKGLEEELDAVGVAHCGGSDPAEMEYMPAKDYTSVTPDPSVGAVLCGFDAFVNYKKYSKAHTYLTKNPGCHFILTNTDATFPSGGEFYPGSGAMSAPLVYSTKMTPTVIGKPNSHMMDAILASKDFDRSRTIMVGDNLETDILFGQNSGIETLLTMTGVTNEDHLLGPKKSSTVPTYIVNSLGDFKVLVDESK